MHFDLTDEQKALREMLAQFFHERLGGARAIEAVRETALDRGLAAEIGGLELSGIMVPAALGGSGLDLLSLAVVAETTGRYCVPAPIVASALAAWLVASWGTAAQRDRWLAGLMSGEIAAAFALQEAAGWLPESWTLQGDRIDGSKRNVEWAGDAGLLVVGLGGGTLALVDAAAEEVSVAPVDSLDRSRPMGEVTFRHAVADPLPLAATAPLIDAMLVLYAADAIGAASAIQALAVDYARERRQFGQLIGAFQALQHQLADMSVEIEPARPLVWYAAHAWDSGRADARRTAALVKAHAGDIAVAVARGAIEAHGGIGYTWEYPAHLFLKRTMHDRAAMGGVSFHRERAAALAGW